jgi:L-glutamine:2-deoxy-scyllo-inosose/3-amino-2,3-dideoxy-scyllo-inosose aminotransferase
VLDVNGIPILVDVEPDTWCLDIAQVAEAITPKTKAVIVVHLYGCMADMDKLKRLCKKHNLYLIEDCAHQHGSFWKDKGVGSLGDIGCFSFQESKTLSSGEGGFNTSRSKAHFERLYSLRNCGRGFKDDMTHAIHSGNYRITEWQAAILLGGLGRLEREVKTRDENAMYLNELLGQIDGILPMRRRSQITQQSYFNFAFRLDPEVLKRAGITNAQFATALSLELSAGWEPPYEPLNNCHLYKPHTKRRYYLSKEYWKKIDPKRFKLPVCEDAHGNTGVVGHHRFLMGKRRDMDDIAAAAAKVMENLPLLTDIPKAVRQRYRALA